MKKKLSSSLQYNSIARKNVVKGVYVVTDLVKTTMGPKGKNIIIEKRFGSPLVTKDGVTVAKHIVLEEPAQSVGVKLCKEVAQKTDYIAGDGTTTSIVLFSAMVKLGMKLIEAGYSPINLKNGMSIGMESACEKLKKISIPADSIDKVKSVSTISSRDKKIGGFISDALDKVGMEGIITVRASQQRKSSVEISSGLEIEKGYLTPNFITKGERMEIELDNAYVFMTDYPIISDYEMEKIIKWCENNKRSLLLIAGDIRRDALGALIKAKTSGRINGVAIHSPKHGQDRLDILDDIAIYTGGSLVSEISGNSLKNCKVSVCGKADRIVVNGRKTIIVSGKGNEEDIEKRIRQLKLLKSMSSTVDETKAFDNRIANLAGGIAVINVGGATEIEMQETKYRVEDGVNAAQAAIKLGVLPGGGKAAWWVAQELKNELLQKDSLVKNDGVKKGYEIVIKALEEPMNQIFTNANIDITQVTKSLKTYEPWVGFNLQSKQMTNMLDAGIVDPTLVTITALKSSVSVTSTLLTSEAIVSN